MHKYDKLQLVSHVFVTEVGKLVFCAKFLNGASIDP